MDVVIAYVDGNDPQWRKSYAELADRPILKKRFRDWGTLKYLLRGIETFMPFVNNVYLVVSGPTQVPSWASGDLKPIFHKDILPEALVPTFNASTIEMGIHRIKGLDEQFLYFNDDMYPVAPCSAEDFYVDGKGSMKFSRFMFGNGLYKMLSKNSSTMARRYLGLKPSMVYVRPQHICSPMLKSVCDELYSKAEEEIVKISTPLREDFNVNQYLYLDYMYYTGRAVSRPLSNTHISLAITSLAKVRRCILHPKTKLVCINDVSMTEKRFQTFQSGILDAFETRLPNKSRFEL
jgi:hypothetical protein